MLHLQHHTFAPFLILQLTIKVKGFLINHKLMHSLFSPSHSYLDLFSPFMWNYFVFFPVGWDLFWRSLQPGSWVMVVLLATLSWQFNLVDFLLQFKGGDTLWITKNVMHRLHEQRDQAAGWLNGGFEINEACVRLFPLIQFFVSPGIWFQGKHIIFLCHTFAVIFVCIRPLSRALFLSDLFLCCV